MCPVPSLLQAVEAAQLAEDLKVQLEHTQAKLKEIQVSVAENRTARERESSNLKRAQVCCFFYYWDIPSRSFQLTQVTSEVPNERLHQESVLNGSSHDAI